MNKRELVLTLVAEGKTTKEISKLTGLKESGVRYHRSPKRRENLTNNIRDRRRAIKLRAIEYKGSKCTKCGYNRCPDALVFHHLDPSQKDFRISSGRTWSWERIREELDKTIMFCNRCHAELHAGLWEINKLSEPSLSA